MEPSYRAVSTITLLLAFIICACLASTSDVAVGQKSDKNQGQSSTSTTRTNNPDGTTTVTTTTTYADGSTTTTINYDKEGHDAGTTRIDKQTKDGEATTTTTTYDGNGHETGKTIERVDKDGNKTITVIDPATGGVKSSTNIPAEKPKPPPEGKPSLPEGKLPDLPRFEYKPDWRIEPRYNWPPKVSAGYNVKPTASAGLYTFNVTTPYGRLVINIPAGLYSSDTFTGTVVTEALGKNVAERMRNQVQLNEIVLDIEQKRTSVAERIFTRTISANPSGEPPSLMVIDKGQAVVDSALPVSKGTPPPPPSVTQLPACGQIGRNIVVMDHCDGVIAQADSCTIGGTQLQSLAESPRMRVMQDTCETPGLTDIKYKEQGREASGAFQNLGVNLSSPNTNLIRNQSTSLEVTALAKGIQQDISLDLLNDTPTVISIKGGDNQHFTIHPADLQADGTYHQNFTVTANQTGAWGATATVSCLGGPSQPIAGEPKAGASPQGVTAAVIPVIPTPTPTPSPASAGPTGSHGPSPSPSPCGPVSFPYTITTYTVTDLGTLPPPDPTNASIAAGVNDIGHIVGGSWGKHAGSSYPHAFRTPSGGAPLVPADDLHWPDVPAGGIQSFAFAVNSAGHVVGYWGIPYHAHYAFWFDGSSMHDLATPKPSGGGEAYALNCHDDVVGIAYGPAFPLGHAAIWSHGGPTMIDLNSLLPLGSGWTLIAAYGINDAGHIVGKGEHLGKPHAFLFIPGAAPVDLGTLPAGTLSVAYGINASDEVVGYSSAKTAFHGFVWSAGTMTDFGTLPGYPLSVAHAINTKGDVVGLVGTGGDKDIFEGGTLAPTSHAVLYSGSALTDLNTLIPTDSGWELKTANGINNKAYVVGAGYYKGSKYLHAFLLTPPGVTPPVTKPPETGTGYVFDNWNVYGVSSSPTKDTEFTIDAPYYITFIADYHWNDGKGAVPGKKGISLKDSHGTVFGPWDVTTSSGQGGVPNVNWECHPDVVLPAGTYTVVDPDPATWSHNDASGNSGFTRVAGHPK